MGVKSQPSSSPPSYYLLRCVEAPEPQSLDEMPKEYEYIDGIAYAMTGSTPEHSIINGNIDFLIKSQLGRSGPCVAHRDQYVVIPGYPPVVPDIVITCDVSDRDKDKRRRPFQVQSPLIVVEVLSPGTERYDKGEKFRRYRLCSTLQIYILVNQERKEVEVYRSPAPNVIRHAIPILLLDSARARSS